MNFETFNTEMISKGFLNKATNAVLFSALNHRNTGFGIPFVVATVPRGSGKETLAQTVAAIDESVVIHYDYDISFTKTNNEEEIKFKLFERLDMKELIKGNRASAITLTAIGRAFEMSKSQKTILVLTGFGKSIEELDYEKEKVQHILLNALTNASVIFPDNRVIEANPENMLVFFTKDPDEEFSEVLTRRSFNISLELVSPAVLKRFFNRAIPYEEK